MTLSFEATDKEKEAPDISPEHEGSVTAGRMEPPSTVSLCKHSSFIKLGFGTYFFVLANRLTSKEY